MRAVRVRNGTYEDRIELLVAAAETAWLSIMAEAATVEIEYPDDPCTERRLARVGLTVSPPQRQRAGPFRLAAAPLVARGTASSVNAVGRLVRAAMEIDWVLPPTRTEVALSKGDPDVVLRLVLADSSDTLELVMAAGDTVWPVIGERVRRLAETRNFTVTPVD